MRGTWQTTDGGGADLTPVIVAFVIAALVFAAFRWITARPWWELALAAIVLALAAAAGWRVRCAVRRMKNADLAQIATIRTLRAEVFPQAVQGAAPPAVEQHVHYHYHAMDAPEAARQALPVTNTQLPPAGQDRRPA